MNRVNMKELLERFQDGSLTCEDYVQRVIQRAQDLSIFNYFVTMDTEKMLEEAKKADARYRSKTNRPLEGVPIATKDNIDIAGQATGACTPGLAGLKPRRTAEVARRLLEAGAIHAGRLNMHELACGVFTRNAYTGDSHNFHNFDFSCGGSSGGSGGAVAADIVPATLGTDTGGSIRIAASYCGVFGLRPTSGRWPSDYGVKMTHLRDSVGPLARSVEDIAILDHVMTGEEVHAELLPSQIRIGVPRPQFWEGLETEVEEQAERFLARLKERGFDIVEGPEIPGARQVMEKFSIPTINHEILPRLKEYLAYHGHDTTAEEVVHKIASADVKAIFLCVLEDPVTEDTMKSAMAAREKLRVDLSRYFKEHGIDCLLMPANKIPPPSLGDCAADNTRICELDQLVTQNDDLANICNNPSLVLPCGFTRAAGVPFGMQIEACSGEDRRLIAIGRAIQKALDL